MSKSIKLNDDTFITPESIQGFIGRSDIAQYPNADDIFISCVEANINNSVANCPTARGCLITIAEGYNNTVRWQFYIAYQTWTIYMRYHSGSTWSAWKSITFS